MYICVTLWDCEKRSFKMSVCITHVRNVDNKADFDFSEWPSPSYICLYVALGENSLDTPDVNCNVAVETHINGTCTSLNPESVCFVLQFGNTCYCNSVLQALYFCRPFREKILAYRSQPRRKENLLTCLADLFHSIANQKRKVGVIPPKKFITRLRKENGKMVQKTLKYPLNMCKS